jgi:hypothetical protein
MRAVGLSPLCVTITSDVTEEAPPDFKLTAQQRTWRCIQRRR